MCRRRILIVDDEAITGLAVQVMLADLGHTVTGVARSGVQALEQVETGRPELVLMDVTLQGEMDGIETALRIQRDFKVPVIFVTGHSDDRTFDRATATSPAGYIVKPFLEEELARCIDAALQTEERP